MKIRYESNTKTHHNREKLSIDIFILQLLFYGFDDTLGLPDERFISSNVES